MINWVWIFENIDRFIAVGVILAGIITFLTGLLPALIRLGNGLAKRKIAIFASSNNLNTLTSLLEDSRLFNKKNFIEITNKKDIGRAENITLLLVYWADFKDSIETILNSKDDKAALIIYAPYEGGKIPDEMMKKLDEKRHVIVANFRGRLLNDLVTSMITTSYENN